MTIVVGDLDVTLFIKPIQYDGYCRLVDESFNLLGTYWELVFAKKLWLMRIADSE